MHYSTVALVQHATISAATCESPALASARQALKIGVDALKSLGHLPDFIWTLLKAPVSPFCVTFCHVIANPLTTRADLDLLVRHVAMLKDLRRFSSGMVKLYGLCDVFVKVASLYVQAKEKEASQTMDLSAAPVYAGQPALNDIDEYLTTLGFAPPSSGVPPGNSDAFGTEPEFDASFLIDWYQGNSSFMNFLDYDL
ncbi:hypothetical protein LTR53_008219 [Teratosphaeriaceae sp. CCFEE 6253]|nr:hypothetical protein LTR53_008219 [Teratosphaeriaceae sp. CCFEE 6253]